MIRKNLIGWIKITAWIMLVFLMSGCRNQTASIVEYVIQYPDKTEPYVYEHNTPFHPNIYEYPGYRFIQFYYLSNDEPRMISLDDSFAPKNKVTIFAEYAPVDIQVVYHFEGGVSAAEPEELNFKYGDKLLTPIRVTKQGHRFTGFFASITSEIRQISNNLGVLPSYQRLTIDSFPDLLSGEEPYTLNLYAQYEILNYTIEFDYNGVPLDNEIHEVPYGTRLTDILPSEIIFTNDPIYVRMFGWAMHQSNYYQTYVNVVDKDNYVYAHWIPMVRFDTQGGNPLEDLYNPQLSNRLVRLVQVPIKLGYTFEYWVDSENYIFYPGSEYTIPPLGAKLTAVYRPTTYTIQFETNNGAIVSPYEYTILDFPLELPTTDKPGYVFDGWYHDIQGSDRFDPACVIYQNIVLYARFTPISYALKFETNGGTTIPDRSIPFGETIVLPPDPTKLEFKFTGWYLDMEYTIAFSSGEMPLNGLTLYAKWEVIPLQPPLLSIVQGELVIENGTSGIEYYIDDLLFPGSLDDLPSGNYQLKAINRHLTTPNRDSDFSNVLQINRIAPASITISNQMLQANQTNVRWYLDDAPFEMNWELVSSGSHIVYAIVLADTPFNLNSRLSNVIEIIKLPKPEITIIDNQITYSPDEFQAILYLNGIPWNGDFEGLTASSYQLTARFIPSNANEIASELSSIHSFQMMTTNIFVTKTYDDTRFLISWTAIPNSTYDVRVQFFNTNGNLDVVNYTNLSTTQQYVLLNRSGGLATGAWITVFVNGNGSTILRYPTTIKYPV